MPLWGGLDKTVVYYIAADFVRSVGHHGVHNARCVLVSLLVADLVVEVLQLVVLPALNLITQRRGYSSRGML